MRANNAGIYLIDSMAANFAIEEWNKSHPRWQEFVTCLKTIAPDQAPFVLGRRYQEYPSCLLVALQADTAVGFLRFAVQPIGPEVKCPPLILQGVMLTEAKIHAFAVCEESRGQGIGTALQKQAIRRATELGCYQVASYSSYGRAANHHIKLSLGFGAQPEVHGDNQQGVYFILPLQQAGRLRYPVVMFDWGDTLMKDDPQMSTPMCQWPVVSLVEGAEEVLRTLHARRTIILATGAAQSGETEIRLALRRVNLEQYFDQIFCFQNTGLRKPSVEFYRHILDRLQVSPADVLMVGDNFEGDVLAANRLGISAAWLNRKDDEDRRGELYRTIHHLRELLMFLDEVR